MSIRNVTLYQLYYIYVQPILETGCEFRIYGVFFSIQDSIKPESGVATSAASYREPWSFIGMNSYMKQCAA